MLGLTAWLILNSALGHSLQQAQNAWVEITPLATQDAPMMIEVKTVDRRLSNPLPPGLALVCSGSEEVAVSCAQRYLETNGAVEPVFQKGVRVTARLRAGKDPVAGVRLSLVPKDLRSRRFITLPLGRDKGKGKLLREIVSDATGRLKTPQLAPGDYVFQLSAPGGQILRKEVHVPSPEALLPKGPRPANAEAVLDMGEIVLDTGVSVAVFVTGPGGEAVSEALVGAYQPDPSGQTLSFETSADRQGKVVISGLSPARPAEVICVAPGFRRLQQRFDAPPPTVGCAMEPLARIDGVVLRPDKSPIAGATVSSKAFERPAGTGKDGRFEIVDLAAGSYELTAAAPGFAPERVSIALEAGQRRELPPIELAPGREVHGVVKDGRSGKPVAGARVVSVEPPGAVDETSGEEGEVIFAAGEEPLRLRASAEGYPYAEVEVDPAQLSEDEPVKIDLQPGGRVRVAVWDEEADQPCAGCPVGVQSRGSSRSTRLVTDAKGEALSELLAPGPYYVSSIEERSLGGMVQVRGGQKTQEVTVAAGGVIPVQFGERTEVIHVRFRPPVPEGWRLSANSPSGSREAAREADGTFDVRRRPGTAVTLALSGSGNVTVQQGVLPANDDRALIELSLPNGTVQGALPVGQSSSGERLVTLVAADGTVRATALLFRDGPFTIPFLPAGTYTLMVDRKPVRSFALAPDQQEDLGTVSSTAP